MDTSVAGVYQAPLRIYKWQRVAALEGGPSEHQIEWQRKKTCIDATKTCVLMELYLIRHADAGSPGNRRYPNDYDRPLSAAGKKDMKKIASGMKRGGIEIDVLFHSGLVRARQTAEITVKQYRLPASCIHVLSALEPEQPPAKAIAALRKMRGSARVAFVGHEPHLSTLAAALVAKDADARIDLKKAGVCRVDLQRPAKGAGTLVALLTPKILKALG